MIQLTHSDKLEFRQTGIRPNRANDISCCSFSLLQKKPKPTAKEVEHILDGNLCRCTGYRPIFDAFKSFSTDDDADADADADVDIEDIVDGEDKKCCKKVGKSCLEKGSAGVPNYENPEAYHRGPV